MRQLGSKSLRKTFEKDKSGEGNLTVENVKPSKYDSTFSTKIAIINTSTKITWANFDDLVCQCNWV